MAKKDLDWGNLGFAYTKTDYRFVSNFKDGKWDDGELTQDANIVMTECAGVLRKNGKLIKDLDIPAEKLAAVIKMVDSGEINRMNGRKTLTAVLEEGVEPVAYAKENGFDKKVDTATIEAIMDKVLAENTQALEDFRNGKVKAKQALFGACMRELKGIGDPAVIREMLDKKLS